LDEFRLLRHTLRSFYDACGKTDAAKRKKYGTLLHDHRGNPTVEIAPFVMSTRGAIHHRTVKRIDNLQKIATRRGFAYELTRRVKVAVVEFELFRRAALYMRQANGTLVWRDKRDEECSDADSDADDSAT
jgi:hypothetical protein